MSGAWGVVGGIVGSLFGAIALLGAGLFAARATRAAAATTAQAQRAASQAAAEPQQRAADLAAFQEIRQGLERRVDRYERRVEGLTSLVRAYAWYVAELTGLMQQQGIDPPSPPERVQEYNRTGV